MKKFTLNKITEIIGKSNIFKLFVGDKCQFDDFEAEVYENGQYIEEIASIYALMEDVANNRLLPKTKFRDITPSSKEKVKEYEFKSKHLRVYAIKFKDGKVIVLGGYKNTQKKDIVKFRSVKKAFLINIEL